MSFYTERQRHPLASDASGYVKAAPRPVLAHSRSGHRAHDRGRLGGHADGVDGGLSGQAASRCAGRCTVMVTSSRSALRSAAASSACVRASDAAPIVARYSRGVGLFEFTSDTCSHRLIYRRPSARRPVSQGPWQSFLATCLGKTDQGRKAGHDAWGISRHARGTSSSGTRANCLPTGSSKRKVADPAIGSMSGLGSRALACVSNDALFRHPSFDTAYASWAHFVSTEGGEGRLSLRGYL